MDGRRLHRLSAGPGGQAGRRRYLQATVVEVVPVWACWLATVLLLAAFAVVTGLAGHGQHAGQPFVDRSGALWPLHSWDAGRYLEIARHGYPSGHGGWQYAFFPLWPGLLSLGHASLLGPVLAVAASLAAFIAVAHLSPVSPRRTALVLALWPGSFALALAYPDGLVLALLAAAVGCAWSERYTLAALLAALAATARPNAWLLVIPLAALAFERRRGRAWLAALAPLLAAAAVQIAFARRSGSLTATTDAQSAWGRTGPLHLLTELADVVRHGHVQTVIELAVTVVLISLCVCAWRTRSRGVFPVYCTAVVVLSIGTGSFQSIGRQSLAAFPLIWLVADDRPGLLRHPLAPWFAGALNVGLWLAIALVAP